MPKSSQSGPSPTHFLCLPLLTPTSTPQLAKSLDRFKVLTVRNAYTTLSAAAGSSEEPLPSFSGLVIPEGAIRPLGVLHLTLGVMGLSQEGHLERALQILQEIKLSELLAHSTETNEVRETRTDPNISSTREQESRPSEDDHPSMLQSLKRAITPPGLARLETQDSNTTSAQRQSHTANPLIISLRGLSAFPRPSKATVLHARPHDSTNRLYNFCLAVRQQFLEAGLMEREQRELVLHATLVNTVYAKKDRRGEKRRMGKITMQAGEIVRVFNECSGDERLAQIEGTDRESDRSISSSGGGDNIGDTSVESREFIWADGIEIDRLRICKMGAKRVDSEMLGQEYEVVGEKMILN